MSIGERISTLREKAELSQSYLAKLLDVSRQAVSKWENDLSSPDTLRLIKLADVLDTEVEYLATGIHPVYEKPIVINLVKKEDKIVEKIIEKPVPVYKRIIRTKFIRNPIEYIAVAIIFFIIGLVIGLIF